MHVPSDSFGGLSPERKASQALEALLTFTAAKIVLAQLEGSGRGALAAYNTPQYEALSSQLASVPIRDAEAWLADLMAKDKGAALRLMDVRAAYAASDFEWDQLQRLSINSIQASNLKLMRAAAAASLHATDASPAPAAPTAGAAPEQQQQEQEQEQGQQQEQEQHEQQEQQQQEQQQQEQQQP